MNEDKQKALKRILKVLVLAERGSTEEERDNARKRAKAMMDEHGISYEELSMGGIINDEGYNMVDENDVAYKAVPKYMQTVYNGGSKHLGVAVIWSKDDDGYPSFSLVGRPSDIEIAFYVMDMIIEEIDRACDNHFKEIKASRRDKTAFKNGAAISAVANLKKGMENFSITTSGKDVITLGGANIVKYEEAVGFWKKSTGGTLSVEKRKTSYSQAGYDAGKDIRINPAVASNGSEVKSLS